MRRMVWIADPEGIDACIRDSFSWGYPRAITEFERAHSYWLRYGSDLVCWLEPHERGAGFHLCSHPGARSRIPPRGFFMKLRFAAELMGFTRLLINEKPDGGPIARYAHRLGFVPGPVCLEREI